MTTAPAERTAGRWLWRGMLLTVFAALAYALSLVVTAPARVIEHFIDRPASVEALGGTVWNGAARLTGGIRVDWQFDRRASIQALALRFDTTMQGPQTRLTGTLGIAPREAVMQDVTGRAGWRLVRAALPDLVLDCTPIATVDLTRLRVSRDAIGAEGSVRTGEGECSDPQAGVVSVPPLLARATMEEVTSRLVLTNAGTGEALGEAEIDGATRLRATVLPAGTRLIPGLPDGAPMMLEMELPSLTGFRLLDR